MIGPLIELNYSFFVGKYGNIITFSATITTILVCEFGTRVPLGTVKYFERIRN